MDKLSPPVGAEALILGAGPTGKYPFLTVSALRCYCNYRHSSSDLSFVGLILAQLLKLNGASHVVLAANKGIKTQIAQSLNAADVYYELDRESPEAQWAEIREKYPHGFDVVVSRCEFSPSYLRNSTS